MRSLALFLVGAATVTGSSASAQAMRDPTYRGLKRVVILAQYGPAGDVAGGVASAALCDEVRAVAGQDAPVPVPVTCGVTGDAVLTQAGTMVLVAQASVTTPSGSTVPMFAIALRPHWEGGLEPAPVYFGAAPRVISYSQTVAGRAARRRVLSAAVADILPWGRQGEHRPPAGLNRE